MTHAHQPNHHFARWHRLSVHASGATLASTGAAWLAVHYLVGAGAGELPHPLEAWLMRLHGLAAYAGMFVLGLVVAAHVPHGWRLARRQRWAPQRSTGLALCALATAASFSGYLLYYFAPETIRPALGWAHAAAGMALTMVLVMHRQGARRTMA